MEPLGFLTSWRTARLTGTISSANRANDLAAANAVYGTCLLTSTMLVSTPVVVADATMPKAPSSTTPVQEMMLRSRSIGLRMRRSR